MAIALYCDRCDLSGLLRLVVQWSPVYREGRPGKSSSSVEANASAFPSALESLGFKNLAGAPRMVSKGQAGKFLGLCNEP